MQYGRRPPEEILCDVFAAECLLPYEYFSNDVADLDISMDAVKKLAEDYKASITSTGSRFAVNANGPCAFVLSESGKNPIRITVEVSQRAERLDWTLTFLFPKGSVAHRLVQNTSKNEDYDEIATDTWFNNGVKNYPLLAEESVLLREWDQCLSLLWFDDDLRPAGDNRTFDSDDEPLLKDLDGVLPWPSKSRRK